LIKIDVAKVSNNTVYMVLDQQIAITNIDNRYSVLNIKCTHLGCTLNVAGNIFKCPCHGSEFKLTGEVLKGPAIRNLELIDYEIVNKTINIYK